MAEKVSNERLEGIRERAADSASAWTWHDIPDLCDDLQAAREEVARLRELAQKALDVALLAESGEIYDLTLGDVVPKSALLALGTALDKAGVELPEPQDTQGT